MRIRWMLKIASLKSKGSFEPPPAIKMNPKVIKVSPINIHIKFSFSNTKSEVIYIDTIYNPLETKTFKYLKDKDIKVFNGLDMLIYQGQKAFYLWNKINPEIDQKLIELLKSKLK